MASAIMKQTCVKCSKGGGIAMCNGCQQSFCVKDFVEHRQELSQQIDNIGQEHDLLRRDIDDQKNSHALFERINQWEQDSMLIIQENASKARADVQQLLEHNKNVLNISVNRLTEELQTCRESDDYTEVDINKWMEQLKELRQMVENPPMINIEYDNNAASAISLINVSNPQMFLLPVVQRREQKEKNKRTFEQLIAFTNENFNETYGDIILSIDGLTGYCTESRWDGSCISGIGRYSSGKHHLRFQIEKKKSSYLFFGIITASQALTSKITGLKSAYGWWEFDHTVVHGRARSKGQNRIIESGDEVTLILDCNNQRIQFQHHRTNILVNIVVNLEQCPFPWKIVLRLDSESDRIKIVI